MKLEVLKSDLKIIEKRIDEFRKEDEIGAPAPEFVRLFIDFQNIINNLKTIDNELFLDINTSIQPRINQYAGFYNTVVNVYYKSELELLRTEVEKALNYILILEKSDNNNDNILHNPLIILDLLFNKFHDVVKQL